MTDHGFLNEMGYVWQTLQDVDGGGDFLDANFRLSPHSETQQNRAKAVPSPAATPSPSMEGVANSEGKGTEGGESKEGEAPFSAHQDLE